MAPNATPAIPPETVEILRDCLTVIDTALATMVHELDVLAPLPVEESASDPVPTVAR